MEEKKDPCNLMINGKLTVIYFGQGN